MSPKQSFVCGFLLALVSVGLFVVPVFFGDIPDVSAQALTGDELFGGEGAKGTTFAQEIGLSPGPSIQVMITRILRTIIGFVGVVVVVMIVYGGFLYMTAGGNTTRIDKAKKILTQSIIGLVIVLSSFAIVQFILSKLVDATGGGIASEEDKGPKSYPDADKFSLFYLSSINTQCAEALRNLKLQFVFSKNVNPSSVAEAIVVRKPGAENVPGTFGTKGSLVTFTPEASCPAPNESAKCFEPDTTYETVINASLLKSTSGASLKCTVEFPCEFSFNTGTAVDVKSPTISMTAPTNGQNYVVGGIELLQAQTDDDTSVSSVDFYVVDDDEPVFISGDNQAGIFSTDTNEEWSTAGYVTNKSYPIWASASDCAGNIATASKVSAILRAANCGNKEKNEDAGETNVDCGGDPNSEFYCGKCNGEDAADGSECASGVSEAGKCISKPRIDMVSPGDGAVGNLITISGVGFGEATGSVTFFDNQKQEGLVVSPYVCDGSTKWSDKEIIVQVPDGAVDGPLEVATGGPEVKTDQTDDAYGPLAPNFDVNAIKRPGLCSVVPDKVKPGFEAIFSGLGLGQKKGSSSLFFKNTIGSFNLTQPDTQLSAVVPPIAAGKIHTQFFTGDYRCVDVIGKETGQLCAEDKDCGEGNTCAKSWCSETLAYCATDANCQSTSGGSCVSVRVGSNKINFEVEDTTPDTATPVISYVDSGWKACEGGANNGKHCAKKVDCGEGECKPAPNWGPIGQYVTIYGTDFGTQKDKVYFQGSLGNDALADTDFPDQCGDEFWSDTSITVKVPQKYQAGGNLTFDTHKLYVKKGTKTSNNIDFVVRDDQPGPAICEIDPATAPANTLVTVYGENLGAQNGAVTFYDQKLANYLFWKSKKVTDASVPVDAKTGPVFVTSQIGYTSNSVNFTVGSCQEDLSCPVGTQCCDNGACQKECAAKPPTAHFAYKVSTGLIPEAPTIIAKCDQDVISPSPWSSWPDSKTICRDAAVTATFSKQMNQASFDGNVIVERCTDVSSSGECLQWAGVDGTVSDSSEIAFHWLPTGKNGFAAGTLHRVTVRGAEGGVQAHEDAGGAFMKEDYAWQFSTAGENEYCEVGGVNVTPASFTATEQNGLYGFAAQSLAKGYQCVVMACAGKNVTWSSSFDGAEVQEPSSGEGLCAQQVRALQETQGNPAHISAQITTTTASPSDFGELTIDFSDPTVSAFFPNCQTACVNALPWARFGTDMDPGSFAQGVFLYACKDALCAQGEIADAGIVQNVSYDPASKTLFLNFQQNKTLRPDKWYRAVLKGNVLRSTSQVFLKDAGSNFGSDQNTQFPNDFSWKFKTKNSDLICKIDSLSVSPKTKILQIVGERQAYTATAYNAPDECAPSGQALQKTSYTWDIWKAEDKTPEKSLDSSKDVAYLLENGAIQLTSNLPAWCSPTCLNTGTSVDSAQALCGDGKVNGPGKVKAEECDGGAVCTGSCLWTGTSACIQAGQVNCCGNSVAELGEQCDDGGSQNGGGCSAQCLNEGSQAVLSICGDGVVDFAPQIGGEDCDDGNTKNGDGCSNKCLLEGSPPVGAVFAVCGNLTKENGEDCDGTPGCSDQCVNEGTLVCAKICSDTQQTCASDQDCQAPAKCGFAQTPCCGNSDKPELGEDCDDGNGFDGDGCSRACLNEGSSIQYEDPSFCGDSVLETGEECEASEAQTLAVGGFAAAQVNTNVYKEVPDNGGYAVSTITASTEGVSATANLQIDCSCQTDAQCGSPTETGCGAGSCCFPRPDATDFEPTGDGPGVPPQGFCRNTTVRVKFTEPMDQKTFEGNIRLALLNNNGVPVDSLKANCPTDYQFALSESSQTHPLVRLWNWVKQTAMHFWGQDVQAAGEKCLAPVKFSVETFADHQWVTLQLQKPLEPNSSYRLSVLGDTTATDGKDEGVVSEKGVSLCFGANCSPTKSADFKTSNEICLLEAVAIEDALTIGAEPYEIHSPKFFSKLNEEHKMVAKTLTYRDGLGVYEPISGTNIYNWTWAWGSGIADDKLAENIVSFKQVEIPDAAHFAAVGNNGTEQIVAGATITVDLLNDSTTVGSKVDGTLEVTAMTCENPWPAPDDLGWKPYVESVTPSNFGFYYCKDKGAKGLDDDLPDLGAAIDVTSVNLSGLIQELLFKVQGKPDAIGVRVFQNPNYLPPQAWFQLQKFTGGYTHIILDGYQGILSGNTAYVAAANQHGSILYPNIYVISYNPNAGEEAKEIFAQILKNWRFNANTEVVSNVGLCKTGNTYPKNEDGEFIPCAWDGECVKDLVGAGCDNEKAKLQKDMKRLTDLTTQISLLTKYGLKNKHCAVTKAQSCTVNAECPGTEICVEGYPTMQKGTFVPAMSVSKWPSWNAELSNELGGALPIDPINEFWPGCKDIDANYDPATCFNGLEGKFVCADRSHVYGYQSRQGGEAYTLYAQLEYAGAPWAFNIDQFSTDDAVLVAEYAGGNTPPDQKKGFVPNVPDATTLLCADTTWGQSTICGDGVLAGNEVFGQGELCEPGDVKAIDCTQQVNNQEVNGKMNAACKGDGPQACKAFQTVEEAKTLGAVCVPYQCGNGVLDPQEDCDDGALNGTYGHCGVGCSLVSAVQCGDGYLAGGEQCDCGTVALYPSVKDKVGSWANLKANGTCRVANGQYGKVSADAGQFTYFDSCSYDCKLPGPSCGDKEINGEEVCDGGFETSASECSKSRVCVGGNKAGLPCQNNNQCGNPGVCSVQEYQLTKTRACTLQCAWGGWSECQGGDQQCGNGKKEGNEECDDGNQSNADSCRKDCKFNLCGDGFVWKGIESCDNGIQNKGPNELSPCFAPYSGSCNYCNTQCQYKTFSGAYCGDGVINGTEACDGAALPHWCVQESISGVTRGKSCQPLSTCEDGFTCKPTGACNGGTKNGLDCTTSDQCGGGVCVFPQCASDCSATCPFTFKQTSILVKSEMPNAQPQQNVDLYSYLNKDGFAPDTAELHLPACRVGTKITANVDKSKVIPPEVDIVFVTDLTDSMDSALPDGKTRIQAASEATLKAIDYLFDAYAGPDTQEKMRIGLVSYGWEPIPGAADQTSYKKTARVDSPLVTSAQKGDLLSIVTDYPLHVKLGWSNPQGLVKAIELLTQEEASNRIRIVILLSDGEMILAMDGTKCDQKGSFNFSTELGQVSFPGNKYCVAESRYPVSWGNIPYENYPNILKRTQAEEIFFYSGVISSNVRQQAYMEHLSSMKCKGEKMDKLEDCTEGEYAYNATTAEGIEQMYQKIVESIVSATTTVTATKNGSVQSATSITPIGNNVNIPIPATFQCQGQPFTMPIKTQFYGTGTVKFDNFTFTYCPIE